MSKEIPNPINPKQPAKPQAGKPASINESQKWNEVRQNWMKERADTAKAHLMHYFETDDDLPLSKHILLMCILSFFLLFTVWASFATLDEVTKGEGKVIPSSEVQTVQTLEAGTAEEILVHEGEEVQSGQILLRLSNVEASSDLGANEARYYGLLAAVTRLQAEAEGKDTINFPEDVIKGSPSSVTEEMNAFRANKQQVQSQTNILEQQLSQREQEVREVSTRITDIRENIRLQEEEKSMLEPLVARGSAPELELMQLRRAIQEKQSEMNGLSSGLPRAQGAVREAKARIADIESAARAQSQTEMAAKQIEMNEVKQRLTGLTDRKDRKEVRSPVNGTIKELNVNTVGGVVRPGENLITIIPKDDQLLVEARIRPSDIAFIYPGQKAVVKITAYDFSIYGGLEAEVVDISADTIQDEKNNSFYRVKLRTFERQLKRKNEVLPIIPGMVASVDVLTGQKTVMEYLMKPFIKTLKNAMSER